MRLTQQLSFVIAILLSFVSHPGHGQFPARISYSEATAGTSVLTIPLSGEFGRELGRSVHAAGDVNGDGWDDLLIGAPAGELFPVRLPGVTYLLFGSAEQPPAEVKLESLWPANGGDGSRGVVLTGIEYEDYAGVAVAGGGDVNGDGIDDFVVGARGDSGQSSPSAAFLMYGRSDGFPARISLSSLPPGRGVRFTRSNRSFEGLGASVALADLNDDGLSDVVVSGNTDVHVVFGATDLASEIDVAGLYTSGGGDGSQGFALTSVSVSVSIDVGDVNADGLSDLLIGEEETIVDDRPRGRGAYVLFGSREPFLADMSIENLTPEKGGDGSLGAYFRAPASQFTAGQSVAVVGDVNQDGTNDFAIGAPDVDLAGDVNRGLAYVVYGRAAGWGAEFDLSSLLEPDATGENGFVLQGVREHARAGDTLGPAGDLNNDGIDDFVVGASSNDPYFERDAEAFVLFGNADGFPPLFPLELLMPENGGDGSLGFIVDGLTQYVHDTAEYHSDYARTVGDFNGDGLDDLLIGSSLGSLGPFGPSLGNGLLIYGRSN